MSKNENQKKASTYYNRFSKVYDIFSSKSYYHKARFQAINELGLVEENKVLNVPVGTGQNFEYLQSYLNNTGLIVGVDISSGMLAKAKEKAKNWENIKLLHKSVLDIGSNEVSKYTNNKGFDAILCDLGLSGFPNWENVIDILISMLSSSGKIVVMDWYIEKPSLRGGLIKWIGKGEVNRPLWQYLETKVENFAVDSSFNRGGVFVASGTKRI